MKILHISSAKSFGGGEKHLVDLCRGLQNEGHDVFVAVRPTCEWKDRLDFLAPGHLTFVTLRNSFGMFSAKRIARFINREGIEVLHAHLARDYVPASLAGRLAKGVSVVLTRHVLFPLKPFYKFLLGNVAAVIGVSMPVIDSLSEIFPEEKLKLIPNGIDTPRRARSNRDEEGESFRNAIGIPKEAHLIGILGEISEVKGQGEFLEMAELVSEEFENCRFIVVGKDNSGGSAIETLKRMVEDSNLKGRVDFIDWIDDTIPFHSALDVYVSASRTESFGLSIVEAMAAGTPVVSTRTPGPSSYLKHGITALITEIGSARSLADAVIVILKDPRLAKELAIAAKAFALEHFSSDKMVAETVNVYRQVKDAVRSVQ